MASKRLFNNLNPISLVRNGIRKVKRIAQMNTRAKSTPDYVDDFNSEKQDYPQNLPPSGDSETIEIIIDGKSYRLINEGEGKYRCEHDLKQEFFDRILPTINIFLTTGVAIARILIDTVNTTGTIIQYYDVIGNELHREAIDQQAKEKANEIAQNYIFHSAKNNRLDPRLLRKADEAFRNKDNR